MSSSQIALIPTGNTVVVSAAAVAPLGIQAPVFDGQLVFGQMRIVNASTNTVHLGVGATAAEAQTNAVAATAGVPAKGIPIVAGAVEILRFSTGVYFSGLAAAASTVYITPGEGL